MRKHTGFGFAIAAAIMTGLAVGFWIITSVDEITASVRSKVATPTNSCYSFHAHPVSLDQRDGAGLLSGSA